MESSDDFLRELVKELRKNEEGQKIFFKVFENHIRKGIESQFEKFVHIDDSQ